jgi:hypothetical protein
MPSSSGSLSLSNQNKVILYFRTPYSISLMMHTSENLCIFHIITEKCKGGVASDGTKDIPNVIKIGKFVQKV